MTTPCPKCGMASTDPEFCSECGAAMAAPAPPSPAAGDGTTTCPICGEARPSPTARFCDTCRYDFIEQKPFSATPTPTPAPSPAPVLATPPTTLALRYDLHATIDLSLRRPEDPMPTDTRERIFPLDLADHLVGRRSDSEDIHPEIPINDPGISRRHLRILRAPDGALSALDLGSMNGSRLNAVPLEPNVPTPLTPGDALTLGCWTRLTVTPR